MSIHGLNTALRNLRQFGVDAERATNRAVNATAQQVRTTAIRKIQSPGGGEVYEKFAPNRTHRASAPGEPPATDTGALASSVSVKASGRDMARVGTGLQYGAYLEHGTQSIQARPWLWPSVLESRADHERRLRQVFDDAIRGIRL